MMDECVRFATEMIVVNQQMNLTVMGWKTAWSMQLDRRLCWEYG